MSDAFPIGIIITLPTAFLDHNSDQKSSLLRVIDKSEGQAVIDFQSKPKICIKYRKH